MKTMKALAALVVCAVVSSTANAYYNPNRYGAGSEAPYQQPSYQQYRPQPQLQQAYPQNERYPRYAPIQPLRGMGFAPQVIMREPTNAPNPFTRQDAMAVGKCAFGSYGGSALFQHPAKKAAGAVAGCIFGQ